MIMGKLPSWLDSIQERFNCEIMIHVTILYDLQNFRDDLSSAVENFLSDVNNNVTSYEYERRLLERRRRC
jgi:hypothetical protein